MNQPYTPAMHASRCVNHEVTFPFCCIVLRDISHESGIYEHFCLLRDFPGVVDKLGDLVISVRLVGSLV